MEGEVSVERFNNLLSDIKQLKETIGSTKTILSGLNADLNDLQNKAMGHLKELGQKSFKSPYGTIGITNIWSWKLPGSQEDFKAFKEWLHEKGIADQYLTVHSAKYNSLINEEKEIADKEGRILMIPGVPQPTLFETVKFTRR